MMSRLGFCIVLALAFCAVVVQATATEESNPDFSSDNQTIRRVASNVTVEASEPHNLSGYHAGEHANLARFAADAAHRAVSSAIDFHHIQKLSRKAALRAANLRALARKADKKAHRATDKGREAKAGADKAHEAAKAARKAAKAKLNAAQSAVDAARLALAKDPTNPKLLAALAKAQKSLAKAKAALKKLNSASKSRRNKLKAKLDSLEKELDELLRQLALDPSNQSLKDRIRILRERLRRLRRKLKAMNARRHARQQGEIARLRKLIAHLTAKISEKKAKFAAYPEKTGLKHKIHNLRARRARAQKRLKELLGEILRRRKHRIAVLRALIAKYEKKLKHIAAKLADLGRDHQHALKSRRKRIGHKLARAREELRRLLRRGRHHLLTAKERAARKARKQAKRGANKAINKAIEEFRQLQAAFAKDPNNVKLKIQLTKAKEALAAARAKMLKAFKKHVAKPYKKGKYLSGEARESCKKEGATKWYLKKYPDVAKHVSTKPHPKKAAFAHWCKHGKREGRSSCYSKSCAAFDPFSKHCKKNPAKWYAAFYPDVKAAFGSDEKAIAKHYYKHGLKQKRLGCFPRQKIAKLKKPKKPQAKPLKKRAPAPAVDLVDKELTDCEQDPTQFYLDTHQDVANWAGPFLRVIAKYHWCHWGQREGRANCYVKERDCKRWINPKENEKCLADPLGWYGHNNPDIERAFGGHRPWYKAHFCRWGKHEGRSHCFHNKQEMCAKYASSHPSCPAHPLKWYVRTWPDLNWAFGAHPKVAKEYFCLWGHTQGWRDNCFTAERKKEMCSPRWDAESAECKADPAGWYLHAWSDLRNAFGKNKVRATEHWCRHGVHERRLSCFPQYHTKEFHDTCSRWLAHSPKCKTNPGKWYVRAYGDLHSAFGNNAKAGVKHFCTRGMYEGRDHCFDRKTVCAKWDPKGKRCKANPAGWYLWRYPDLKAAFGDNHKKARHHYEEFGREEGRANCFKKRRRHHRRAPPAEF